MEKLVLELPIFDLYEQRYLPYKVVYYNTLLQYLYPDVEFAVGDVSGFIQKGDIEGAIAALEQGWEDFKVDGGTNSRRLGRCIFARCKDGTQPNHFLRLFGSNSGASNYGSNLTSECELIVTMKVKIRIVNDGQFRTGDCHAKASASFFKALGLQAYVPFQFRAVDPDKCWLSKGTVAYLPSLDDGDVSLVLPRSSFKGNSPGNNGIRVPKNLAFGVVQLAPRKNGKHWGNVSSSYSVIQFLPWKAVEQDILPRTLEECKRLNELTSDRTKLVKHLAENIKSQEGPALEHILEHDVNGVLATHPWTVKRVLNLFREYQVQLATAGVIKFNYSMAMPDAELKDGEVCIPGIKDGEEIIVFSYPCRWRWDLKVWVNRAIPRWQNFSGIIAANQETWLSIGRDTDGDQVPWIPKSKLPNVGNAIAKFGVAPKLSKAKEKVEGSLAEILVRAMDNQVGLISHLIAKANALGKENLVLELAQELQTEVDSLKHAARATPKVREKASQAMRFEQVLWLKHYRDKDVYVERSLPVSQSATDTISRLIRAVNEVFIPPSFRMANLRTFASLFPQRVSPAWLNAAEQRCKEYAQDVAIALEPARRYQMQNQVMPRSVQDEVDENLKALSAKYKKLLDRCQTAEERYKAVTALWQVQHRKNSPNGSTALVFMVGLPEILAQLKQPPIQSLKLIGLQGSDYPNRVFTGETVKVVVGTDSRFPNYMVARDQEGKVLGTFTEIDGIPVQLEQQFKLTLYTRFNRDNKPTRIDALVTH
ncbi:MAG: hypothetical protein LDL41_05920 [Coleofasciculus sp. S288]|nr:hypothetical protein [Coleofasciculus sp. S288]